MRILLISANTAKTPYPVYPLGMSIIAGALKFSSHTVEQYDFLHNECSLQLLSEEIKSFIPDIVGISIRNIDTTNLLNDQCYINIVKDIVSLVHNISSAKVVLGGSGFSVMPELILNIVSADYGIVGEGEKLFKKFIDDAARNVYPEKKCLYSDSFICGSDICMPAHDPEILKYYLKYGNMASVQTKRGCPHSCIYCSYPLLEGRMLRCRNPKDVVAEILDLQDKYAAKFIFFSDSVFNDDKGHYLEFIREMKRQKINIPWAAFFKPGNMSAESIEIMKETGLSAVEIGADASTDASLKILKKPFKFSDIAKTNKLFRSFDIPTAHYYMFGLPGETEEMVHDGIHNVLSVQDTVSFIIMGIRILPGTHLSEIALEEGIIKSVENLLDPTYYLSGNLDRGWLERTLSDAFKNKNNCIFPPNAMDDYIDALHNMGHTGVLWNLLLKKRKRK